MEANGREWKPRVEEMEAKVGVDKVGVFTADR
jgi:hypothetical protein